MGANLNAALARPWMNVGTTMGAGADIMHVGLLQRPAGTTNNSIVDAVVAWGCNDQNFFPQNGPDNLRFLFLAPSNQTVSPGSGPEGLETMRITPWGNVGVGNFSSTAGGLGGPPRAKLDVQFFEPIPANTANVAVNVVNTATNQTSQTKTGVQSLADNVENAVLISVYGGNFTGIGGRTPYGVFGTASRDDVFPQAVAIGVGGEILETVDNTTNVGVSGRAGNLGQNGSAWGVHGSTFTNQPNHWAGYFNGNVNVINGTYQGSDENLKENIESISSPADILNALNPVSYNFVSSEVLALNSGTQYGLIAQEVEDVLPELVLDTEYKDPFSEDGESIEYKSLRYNDFIAILIAGFQQQNSEMVAVAEENDSLETQVAELSQELAELSQKLIDQANQMEEVKEQMNTVMESFQSTQSKMNNCCGNAPAEKDRSETGAIELEQNFPNPFDIETTINFTIHERAQIRLEISDANGRVLDVLVNGQLDKGQYTERWDASAYASGTYYYSLYANTELLTKKMIKR
jgi:uncharacterized coiled-coil protein SlyX